MQVEMQLSGVDDVLSLLKGLPDEVVSKRGGPVRASLRKGAVVILKAELANLATVTAVPPIYSTGLLSKNVVVTRGKPPTDGNGERYIVRVRRKTYPGTGAHGKGKAVTTLKAAQLLEYGSEHQAAEPWIRPAFESRAAEAITTSTQALLTAIDRIVRKLAKSGQGLSNRG